MKRRIGKFRICSVLVDPKRWERLLPVFAQMVVIRCEMDHSDDAFHYVAFSPLFDDCPLECEMPRYEIEIDNGVISARRSSASEFV